MSGHYDEFSKKVLDRFAEHARVTFTPDEVRMVTGQMNLLKPDADKMTKVMALIMSVKGITGHLIQFADVEKFGGLE
jgi:signal transduction histidine kinase